MLLRSKIKKEVQSEYIEVKTEKSVPNTKKSYAAFLIDRPFNAMKQNQHAENDATFNLMNCLRYRLRLTLESMKPHNSAINTDFSDLEALLASDQLCEESSSKKSLYDTLLKLIDEYDAAGSSEIFRLLLERRTAIPLFVPDSKKHHLEVLRHITLPWIENIRLGEDKSLMRVAVVSCRPKNESQTCNIIKNLFNIESIYRHDLSTGSISSNSMLAEIGCGCMPMEGSSSEVRYVLVTHIIGDFKPLWQFIQNFADFLLVEASPEENLNLFVEGNTQGITDCDNFDLNLEAFTCIWKPSIRETTRPQMKEVNGFHRLLIEGQLSDRILNILRSGVNTTMKNLEDKERLMLCQIPILVQEEYEALECVSPTVIEASLSQSVQNLGKVKKNEFLLQKNYQQQAKHEEAQSEHRLNEDKFREEDDKIRKCREKRRADTCHVQNHPLLRLFLALLAKEDSCSRVLSVRVLEKNVAERSERELGPLLEEIRKLSALYFDQSSKEENNNTAEKNVLKLTRGNLHRAKTNFIESALNIEHLWRELSHLYTSMKPKSRSSTIKSIPRLAAQHLLDGFCLELLDGDSNMIHMEWVTEVLHELGKLIGKLKRERIFVLSVMGIQSSGKSTLLNTMFGIRMRTSVGMCTRGVNMQLLAVEGRPEYDYILLLDTEGTRAPEYHGLPGREKRDNQMATLSILLSDATIIVTQGENDDAIKEILPIVLMAYQGSKLAEANGGRLSSRMFFVYNRIETRQKHKLYSIIQSLGTSLHDAFHQVRKLTGNLSHLKSESPFGNFKLDTSSSTDSDVCILSNVKKESKPPGDVPDEAYGEGLVQFREHIHRRVISNEDGSTWKSRSIDEFSNYIKDVWKCICSADFTFNFATVTERIAFDQLDVTYKKVEQKLAEVYLKSFASIKKKMIEEKGKTMSSSMEGRGDGVSNENLFSIFADQLRDEILPIEQILDTEVKEILAERGREKWSLQFHELWRMNKIDQSRNWVCNLKSSFITLFNYEHHVENYKKKMRQEINEFFKSASSDVSMWTEPKKNEKFEKIFNSIVNEAQEQFPLKDIGAKVKKVYQNSNVIRTRQIEITPNLLTNNGHHPTSAVSNSSVLSTVMNTFSQLYSKMTGKGQNKNAADLCIESVDATVNRIAAGKQCYDDTVVSSVICGVDAAITSHNISENSEVQIMHSYGHSLIVALMEKIEAEWEAENSVYAKLKSNKESMREYFIMVSQGVEKTKLFAANMANTLIENVYLAFEKEMIQRTLKGIRNERWLYDARFLSKHMDLFLIDLLEKNEVSKALNYIARPKGFYEEVLNRLVAEKVPKVDEEYEHFFRHVKQAINNAAIVTESVDHGRAQKFVDQLRVEFLKGYLQSEHLASKFLIDCSGEYDDCDNEEKLEFQRTCSIQLIQALREHKPPKKQMEFAMELSPKVVQFMRTSNDPAALPRCDAHCPLCFSLCIESANHDTKLRPHDAIHQPGGISGLAYRGSNNLVSTTCSQSYEKGRGFYLGHNYDVMYKYKDYAKVFPGWKNPRIAEELPLREYILAVYNKDIARMHNTLPCTTIPSTYFRSLSTIKKQLKRDIGK